MLDSPEAVERALEAYGSGADPHADDELARRLNWLQADEADVLIAWYLHRVQPASIALAHRRSIRHVYRVRARGLARLLALGQHEEFRSADVTEFA